MINGSLFGNYTTNKFTDYYGKVEDFIADYKLVGIPQTISDDSISTLYYLLYATYGNSHIASSDPTQFKYKLFSIIFMYGPTWEKELDIQKSLRELSLDELVIGSTAINNRALNDQSAPNTQTTNEIPYINEQVVTKYRKSKLEAYSLLSDILKKDVTKQFIDRFKVCFIYVVQPQEPLWYVTKVSDSIDDEQEYGPNFVI